MEGKVAIVCSQREDLPLPVIDPTLFCKRQKWGLTRDTFSFINSSHWYNEQEKPLIAVVRPFSRCDMLKGIDEA